MTKPKCWKKVTDTPKLIEFSHICSYYNHGLVQVHKTNNHSPPWRTSLHWEGKFVKDELKTSREDALSVAKKFMKGYTC